MSIDKLIVESYRIFQPNLPSSDQIAEIIRNIFNTINSDSHIEKACDICCLLRPKYELQKIEDV